MGQKVNSTSLRLKKRLNWTINSNVHNYNNINAVTYKSYIISEIIKKILMQINFFTNNLSIVKDSKNYRIFSRVIHQNNIYNNLEEYTTQARNHYKIKQNGVLNKLYLNKKNILCEFNDFILKKTKLNFLNFTQNKFLILSPKIITLFVLRQLKETPKLKTKSFNRNFQNGLVRVANTLLFLFKNNIIGLKIICAGKWKKTRTGRKQKICLRFGKIQKTSVSNIIFFNWISQKTKYGSCGIKIWIAHKKFY